MTETPSGTASEPLVANPYHVGLQQLRARLAAEAAEIGTGLDDTAAKMGAGLTWTGPVARGFAAEAEGNKQRLRRAVQRLVEAVDAQLRRTPERVTASEAKFARMDLRGY